MFTHETSPSNYPFTALYDAESTRFSRTSLNTNTNANANAFTYASNSSFDFFDINSSLSDSENPILQHTRNPIPKQVRFPQELERQSLEYHLSIEWWSKWLSSLWNRTFQTCNSYILSFFMIVTLLAPCLSIFAAFTFSQNDFYIQNHCDLRWRVTPNEYKIKMTTSIGAKWLIPIGIYTITLLIGLSIGIMCTKSRRRVFRAALMGQTANLASTFMLPCYEYLWYTLAVLGAVGIFLSAASISIHPPNKHERNVFFRDVTVMKDMIYFPCDYSRLPMLYIIQMLPILMIQRCISRQAVRKALAFSGIPICLIIMCYTMLAEAYANLLTVIIIVYHIYFFVLCVYAKLIVQVRYTFDIYFLIIIIDSMWCIAVEILGLTQVLHPSSAMILSLQNVTLSLRALVIASFLLSLRADTQYWLGIDDEIISNGSTSDVSILGTHGPIPTSRKARARFVRAWMQQLSDRGFITNCSTQTSVFNVHQMIEEHRKNVIDFSSLGLEKIVAQGATAVVMKGVMYNTTAIPVKSQLCPCRQHKSQSHAHSQNQYQSQNQNQNSSQSQYQCQPNWYAMDPFTAAVSPYHLTSSRRHEHLHVHRQDRRTVSIALKIYLSVQATDDELYRFSRETALNRQLCHPNIVYFYGLCVIPPLISLVFEYCDGGSLDVALKTDGNHWSLPRKLQCWLNACRAVAYLHSFSPPLLHRDIKTDNFLLDKFGVLKLTDFGEANILRPRSDGTMTITGTVDFMAPEMIIGGKTARYDTAVDVYSLMITLWQILMPHESPWGKKTHLEVYNAIVLGERPSLRNPAIPSKCATILRAGWAPDPIDRISVEEILPRVEQLWLLSLHQKPLKRVKASRFHVVPNIFTTKASGSIVK